MIFAWRTPHLQKSFLLLLRYSWGKKDSTKHYFPSRTTLITSNNVGGVEVDLPSRKTNTFFRSLAVSVSIWKRIIIPYCINIFSKFETWPICTSWLEICINWYTKSQGSREKSTCFTRERIHPSPAHSTCNYGSFTPCITDCSKTVFFFCT